jgi:hypothetical protein
VITGKENKKKLQFSKQKTTTQKIFFKKKGRGEEADTFK